MAWLATHSATNKVDKSDRQWVEQIYYIGTNYTRTVTDIQYEYVGMTYAAAIVCRDAMVALNYGAVAESENNGGGWKVIVNVVTATAWA
jgi:hypothetical protein